MLEYHYLNALMFKQVFPYANLTPYTAENVLKDIEGVDDTTTDDYNYLLLCNVYCQINWNEKMKGADMPDIIKKDYDKFKNKCDDEIKNKSFNLYRQLLYYNLKLNENKDEFIDDCNRMFKNYKDIYKLGSNTPENDIKIVGQDIKKSKDYFTEFLRCRDKAKVMSYNHQFKEWGWLDDDVYKEEMKRFKGFIKQKKIVCDINNNNEHSLNGAKWYSLCLQQYKNDELTSQLDIGSIEVFKYFINGFVYYFKNEKDRDNAFKYLTK